MRTVPYHLAELAVGDLIAPYGVQVGAAVEIDLDRLALERPDAAETILRYAAAVRDFVDGPYIAVAVPVHFARQTDNADGRHDLVAELEALECSELGEVTAALLASQLDVEQVLALGAAWQIELVQLPAGRCQATLTVAGGRPWSVHLGGGPSSREVARRIQLTVSHAPWRDRRSRRLLAVHVQRIEVLPDVLPDAERCVTIGH